MNIEGCNMVTKKTMEGFWGAASKLRGFRAQHITPFHFTSPHTRVGRDFVAWKCCHMDFCANVCAF